MKTLAVRLEDEQHARLTILARLSGISVTDAIRSAIENHIGVMSQDPAVSARAAALQEEIEREAREQRDAIAGLFGAGAVVAATTPTASQPSSATPAAPDQFELVEPGDGAPTATPPTRRPRARKS